LVGEVGVGELMEEEKGRRERRKVHTYLLSTLIILKGRPIEIQQVALDEDGEDSL
jgi:hypothetical protein